MTEDAEGPTRTGSVIAMDKCPVSMAFCAAAGEPEVWLRTAQMTGVEAAEDEPQRHRGTEE